MYQSFDDFQKYNNNLTNTFKNYAFNDTKQINYSTNKEMK